ncbi:MULTISPECIES: FG-GAP-like repeat-containing protein [unclassified Streptomyces]|uniref:FG-GAP-like repeat-containing protein n=1 Tax=unclassified Streptomyces TaxID=2593676 RepID=UPI001BEA9836|nr:MULTISPECIES: FG-GAP-like repeat-containing protein [unclassified Streptomyces]MBT2465719.1 VCBS repeat-containing protein [Streptomyces sp. ISL-63]
MAVTATAMALAIGAPTALSAPAEAAVAETPAEAGFAHAVEDGSYPYRADILGLTGADLIAGDGNITYTSCSDEYQIKVWARYLETGESRICFTAASTGYLRVNIPRAYRIETYDRDIKASISIDGTTENLTVPRDTSKGFGEADPADPRQAVLLDMRVTGSSTPPPAGGPGDTTVAFATKLTIGAHRSCTGTLINTRWLLTASTCFADDPATSGTVAAGPPKWKTTATIGRPQLNSTGGQVREVVELIPRADRDLVLARLSAPVTGITPLPRATSAPVADQALKVVGYGRTEETWTPQVPHTAAFTTGEVKATEALIDGSPLCKGDAGAPVVRDRNGQMELVAVASRSWQGGCLDSTETRTGASAVRVDDIGPWVTMATGARWGQADENAAASQQLSGDFDGDGKADTAVLHTYPPATGGARHAALWKFTSTAAGTYNPVRGWDNLVAGPGSWDGERSKAVAGDFNGDGRADVAVLYNNGQNTDGTFRTALWTFFSNGTGFDAPVVKWSSGTASWNWDRLEPFAGDFNGDGKADVGVLYDMGTASDGRSVTRLWTFTSSGDGFTAPAVKWTSSFSWAWDRSLPVPGDYNGDGKTDVAVLYNNGQNADGRNQTRLWTLSSNGAGFDAPVEQWYSGTMSWDWTRSKPFAGDYNGDGKADIGILYNNGQHSDGRNQTTLWTSNGDSFDAPVTKWSSGTGSWDWNRTKPVTGDFNGDGKADIHVLYDYGQRPDNTYRAGLWRFTSTGPAFTNPLLIWDSSNIAP